MFSVGFKILIYGECFTIVRVTKHSFALVSDLTSNTEFDSAPAREPDLGHPFGWM
jgi:hypothetical protein